MRLPNPPIGSVSWLGKSRSYDANPISGRRSIVSVRSSAPSCRASRAWTGSAKKIYTWPPLPDLDRSSAAGISLRRHVSTYASASAAHWSPSKSAARNQLVAPEVGMQVRKPTVVARSERAFLPARSARHPVQRVECGFARVRLQGPGPSLPWSSCVPLTGTYFHYWTVAWTCNSHIFVPIAKNA